MNVLLALQQPTSIGRTRRQVWMNVCWTTIKAATTSTVAVNILAPTATAATTTSPDTPAMTTVTRTAPRSTTTTGLTLTIERSDTKLGLELITVPINGTSGRTVAAIQRVLLPKMKQDVPLQPGMILPEYTTAREVQERLQQGPFPLELTFYALDAYVDEDINSNQDMAQLTHLTIDDPTSTSTAPPPTPTTTTTTNSDNSRNELRITELSNRQQDCNIQSRRNDLLEIVYTARYGSPDGPIYDSSLQRGTGQPYFMVLGSGDMIVGVDQGLYSMCPGDVRLLEIPSRLGHGPRARAALRIPDDKNTKLYWTIRMESLNGVRSADTMQENREERE